LRRIFCGTTAARIFYARKASAGRGGGSPAGIDIGYPIEAEHYEHHQMSILNPFEDRSTCGAGIATWMSGDRAGQ
jgi:hypothetical protein